MNSSWVQFQLNKMCNSTSTASFYQPCPCCSRLVRFLIITASTRAAAQTTNPLSCPRILTCVIIKTCICLCFHRSLSVTSQVGVTCNNKFMMKSYAEYTKYTGYIQKKKENKLETKASTHAGRCISAGSSVSL